MINSKKSNVIDNLIYQFESFALETNDFGESFDELANREGHAQMPGATARSYREPAVAGSFYPASPPLLARQIEWCFSHPLGPGELPKAESHSRLLSGPIAIIAPHAGLIYSGPFAAHGYNLLGQHDTVVIFGPNHRGSGEKIALAPWDSWRLPEGNLALDQQLADEITRAFPALRPSAEAHLLEHSLELQAIFLSHLFGQKTKILPIAFGGNVSLEECRLLARAIFDLMSKDNRFGSLAFVASTDLSHYLPDEAARLEDLRTVGAIETLDSDLLERRYLGRTAGLCGFSGVATTIELFRLLGAKRANRLAYGTSGDTGGPRSEVVGYASLMIEAPP